MPGSCYGRAGAPRSKGSGDKHPDLVVQQGDRQWLVEFKHWARPAAEASTFARLAKLLHLESEEGVVAEPSAAGLPVAGAVAVGLGLVSEAWSGRSGGTDAALGRLVRQLPALDAQTLQFVTRLVDELARLDPTHRREATAAITAAMAASSDATDQEPGSRHSPRRSKRPSITEPPST